MFILLEAQKNFTPMSCSLVRIMLLPSPRGHLSSTDKSCHQRRQNQRTGDGGTPQEDQMPIIDTDQVRDRVGMGCMIQNIDALQRKGKCQDHIQWYSMRRTTTLYNNAWEAGAGSLETGNIYSENEKRYMSPFLPLQADGSQYSCWGQSE